MIETIILLYLAVVLSIGFYSKRLFKGTSKDYFVASHTIGPFVLLMTLFGTHMTAFSLWEPPEKLITKASAYLD